MQLQRLFSSQCHGYIYLYRQSSLCGESLLHMTAFQPFCRGYLLIANDILNIPLHWLLQCELIQRTVFAAFILFICVVAQILAGQFRTVGVQYHYRGHVNDKEIIFILAAIAHGFYFIYGPLFSLLGG